MTELSSNDKIKHGTVKIANEVVSVIAGLAATEIEGVTSMSGGITGDITEMLGMKNLSKGVKVEVGEKETAIDIYIIVEYGYKISEVASKVQQNVKDAVETMTGLKVVEVNVNVQGVNIPKEESKIEAETRVK
ncbi:MAG: Asp23/Gls24 family envelope stress response protein [Tissierellia bacterium]|nr:Asp23/Gls24 family envelope stress response protein [Tissierellia bacterium]